MSPRWQDVHDAIAAGYGYSAGPTDPSSSIVNATHLLVPADRQSSVSALRQSFQVSSVSCLHFLLSPSLAETNGGQKHMSAVGDPGMRRDGLRVAIESWNQCNEVGQETPGFGSPRAADCFDLIENRGDKKGYRIVHKVTEEDNTLGGGKPIPGMDFNFSNVDEYAPKKELYLASKCQVQDKPRPWHFWMIMLKNGNMDTYAGLCPKDGHRVGPYGPDSRFDCFGKGCMGHPTMDHDYSQLVDSGSTLRGRFYGTWDLDANGDTCKHMNGNDICYDNNSSFYSVTWEKEVGKGGWVFHHVLRTSTRYPWLMLYLRSDATQGFSGGYHYETRGITNTDPGTPPIKRHWSSINLGTEVYRDPNQVVEWTVSNFDIIVPEASSSMEHYVPDKEL